MKWDEEEEERCVLSFSGSSILLDKDVTSTDTSSTRLASLFVHSLLVFSSRG